MIDVAAVMDENLTPMTTAPLNIKARADRVTKSEVNSDRRPMRL